MTWTGIWLVDNARALLMAVNLGSPEEITIRRKAAAMVMSAPPNCVRIRKNRFKSFLS
jgi:hypothetical protein